METEPEKPSTIQNSKLKTQNTNSALSTQHSALLKGDLDNIILKSLRKNPSERYSSVQEFSEDIRRHLVGLPVSARPLTYGYRAAKFYQRNKVSVIAGAFVFLALFTGIIVALWQAQIARTERARAENRFNEVRELANNVIFKYHDAIAALPGATAAREMLVTDALKYLDNLSNETEGNTELQRELAAAYFKLGDVQGKQYEANIGDTAGAVESYKKAVALLESVVENDAENLQAKLELVRVYEALFALYMRFADVKTKAEVLNRALNLQNELISAEPNNLEFQMQKIRLLSRKADSTAGLENSLKANLEALQIAENLSQTQKENSELNTILMKLNQRAGSLYIFMGDKAVEKNEPSGDIYARAVPFHEKSLAFAEKIYRTDENNLPNRRRYAVALLNLAETLAKNGVRDETKIRSAIELLEKTANEDGRNLEAQFDLAESNRVQAEIREKFGEHKKAIKNLETAFALYQKIRQTDSKNLESVNAIVEAHRKLAALYALEKQTAKAEFHKREFERLNSKK